jgi:cellobiose phosphorylase
VHLPELCLLSNGHYHVLLTAAGSGYSVVDGMDVTRWREDTTCDSWGQYCYVRDADSGRAWSVGRQPLGACADEYEAELRPERAAFRRRDDEIQTFYEVAVVPDANAEIRRVTLTNNSSRPRVLEVTSYAEIALNSRRADQAHPAFGKLFLETERCLPGAALLCRRRPRARDQQPVWALHVLADSNQSEMTAGDVQFETDRARFLGRGRSAANPVALETRCSLSGTTGSVLDPIFSLRRRVRLAPGAIAVLGFTTAAPADREEAVALANRFANLHDVDSVLDEAASTHQAQLAARGLTLHDAVLFQKLAAHVIFASRSLRSQASVAGNHIGQQGLWRHAISGDLPIVLLRSAADGSHQLTRDIVKAHEYWRNCGLTADLVIVNEGRDDARQQLEDVVDGDFPAERVDKPGGVFLRDVTALSSEDITLLEAAARVILRDCDGSLTEQLAKSEIPPQIDATRGRNLDQSRSSRIPRVDDTQETENEHLQFENGLGGFTCDGSEYVIRLQDGVRPPAPWSNVIANPQFGCLVTEGGAGYTWAGNSQANRLTPWSNDPVSDPPGEAVYIRDDDTGQFWTPTPAPCGDPAPIVVRHGQGYSRFISDSHGLAQDLLILVSPTAPVKLYHLRIRNHTDRPRHLSATFYAEWVIGVDRDQAPLHVVCAADPESGTLFATSAWAGEFAGRVAFADASRPTRSFTTDRAEFLGREGTLAAPAALVQGQLSSRVADLSDPCAAIMTPIEIPSGAAEEVVFVLGQAASPEEARRLARAHASLARAEATLTDVRALWDRILGAVQVRTPDAALDVMLNRWLLYQTLACRMWGRSGFFQSGGAFGFRDQLQDAMATVYGAPQETRAQILRASARQFSEGDVQHWWHPPGGRGVRTRITDDLYFLPFVVSHYVRVTGDSALLDECVPFLSAPVLRSDQDENFGLPAISDEVGTVYDHCVRALEYGLKLGPHGLPLMGTGDWNDGMNHVGIHGQGESVWNGWFMLTTLREFAALAQSRRDTARSAWCLTRAEALRASLEEHGWDGAWYRRAYFDDGTPLGSATNDECQIDSIAQTWAVISGAADPARACQAMAAVQQRLVRDRDELILLFDPPFDRGTLEPGYIKGYVPGIRENGGQYTHAATWAVLATALLGQSARAAELFGMLNPIRHADSPEGVDRYKVEPYVMAGDVYGAPPHTGRGGWTWYSGSSGWMYRVGLETILGFRLRAGRLEIEPCIPPSWSCYEVTYCHGSATYHVVVENSGGSGRGVRSLAIDGHDVPPGPIDVADDGSRHEIHVATT